MKTTTLTYSVTVNYESARDMDEADIEACRLELELTLNDASTMGRLDPPNYTIETFALEVKVVS